MTTTIRISRNTKKLLEEIGHKGQSFDDIVRECAIALRNNRLMYVTNSPVETSNGIEYIEIHVPKNIKEIRETNILGITLEDSLGGLCEEHNIKF